MLRKLLVRDDADRKFSLIPHTYKNHPNNLNPFLMQQIKKGKIQYEAVMKSIDTMMPDELRDETKRAVESCKTAAVGIKDPCEASYTILGCMWREYPEFFLP